jgi:1-acyl-sn-glycerol-3-phosphate acyltransferase
MVSSEIDCQQSLAARSHRVIDWLITPAYVVLFFSILVIFHPIHAVATCFSKRLHKQLLDLMNICIVLNIRFTTGARYRVIGAPALPANRSVIIVSNHQSMYDIPMIMWECRSREVGFIAKRELGRWIPSISMALRRLGSVLIDRKDAAVAVRQIQAFGREKERLHQVAAVFPEGTRARDGVMKRFKTTGLKALLETMPSAIVQPVAIRGNWQLLQFNFWPVPFGTSIELEFLEPIEPEGRDAQEIACLVEQRITAAIRLEISAKSA